MITNFIIKVMLLIKLNMEGVIKKLKNRSKEWWNRKPIKRKKSMKKTLKSWEWSRSSRSKTERLSTKASTEDAKEILDTILNISSRILRTKEQPSSSSNSSQGCQIIRTMGMKAGSSVRTMMKMKMRMRRTRMKMRGAKTERKMMKTREKRTMNAKMMKKTMKISNKREMKKMKTMRKKMRL